MDSLKLRDKIILWSLGIVALGYMYYRYILSQYSFKFNKVVPHNISMENIDVDLLFDVTSNIGVSFEIQQINASVLFNGINVGTINQTENIVVPNDATKTIAIPFSVDLTQLKQDSLSLITSVFLGNNTKNISVTGFTSVKISGLPITIDVDFDQTMSF